MFSPAARNDTKILKRLKANYFLIIMYQYIIMQNPKEITEEETRVPQRGSPTLSGDIIPLNPLTWHNSKDQLLAQDPKAPLRYALSKDFVDDQAFKRFCRFDSYDAMIAFLERSCTPHASTTPHFYELIPEAFATRVFLFFDLDRPLDPQCDADICQDPIAYLAQLLPVFESVFVRFLKHVYDAPEDFTLTLGRNYHVAHALSPTKFSCHIKLDLVCPSVHVHKTVTQNLDKFLCSNLYVTPDERSFFYYYKAQKVTPVFDPAVYTQFRSYRTLYSAKRKRTAAVPLVPFGASSPHVRDHLVVAHAEYVASLSDVARFALDARVADIQADFSRIKDAPVHLSVKTFSQSAVQSLAHADSDPHSSAASYGQSGCISRAQIDHLESFLLNHPSVRDLFGPNLGFKYSRFTSPTMYVFFIDKSCQCMCPYAGRVHAHNRSFFEYHVPSMTLMYKCFDEDCCHMHRSEKRILFRLQHEFDALVRLSSMSHIDSLHGWQHIIPWNELYDSQDMLDYPLRELVGIRGNMGSAKTKVLIDVFIDQFASQPGCKCLFITYQRILSNKYAGALKCRGFVNYLDCTESAIHDPKIIVCLDSLWKVATRNFDFVFVDEVLSVLLHFNSPLMRQVQMVSSVFELLLLQARHIYLLDACVDNSMVYHFVQYLAQRKNVVPYWIRNTHVRRTNRVADVVVNKSKKKDMENGLRMAAVEKVIALLRAGKRVVCSSSTKSFTELLVMTVKGELEDKDVLLYHSGTDKALVATHAGNTAAAWGKCDLLVYSPTISAGLSFEVPHFHQLVGYCENSLFTPSVDTVLQQLFRVRQLVDGHMHLFVNDTMALWEADYPVQESDVDTWLDRNVAALCKYFPDNTLAFESASVVKEGAICYDRDRLSYHVLKGIVLNKNRSLLRFTKILTATLREDYGIPCAVTEFGASADVLQRAFELFSNMKRVKLEGQLEFSPDLVIGYDAFEPLDAKKVREKH